MLTDVLTVMSWSTARRSRRPIADLVVELIELD